MKRNMSNFEKSYRNVYHHDVTIKTFLFESAYLTTSTEGELANQNAAYKIIALECQI